MAGTISVADAIGSAGIVDCAGGMLEARATSVVDASRAETNVFTKVSQK
jgi:hypothetical protein